MNCRQVFKLFSSGGIQNFKSSDTSLPLHYSTSKMVEFKKKFYVERVWNDKTDILTGK